jgi:hypothetical protein
VLFRRRPHRRAESPDPTQFVAPTTSSRTPFLRLRPRLFIPAVEAELVRAVFAPIRALLSSSYRVVSDIRRLGILVSNFSLLLSIEEEKIELGE